MRDPARLAHRETRSNPPCGRRYEAAVSPAAKAFALQRIAGNRVAARVLPRRVERPDAEPHAVTALDLVATEFA